MYKRRESEIDLDSAAAFLQDVVEKVKTQENPDILNEVKKVFKKNVPFALRNYVAAYFVKETVKHFHGAYRSRKADYRDSRDTRRTYRERSTREVREPRENRDIRDQVSSEERAPRVRVQIDPELAATIFISIGRNRRVFPRDLVGLLVGAAGLDRDRIGDIRVLANYSFIQLFKEDAEKAISVLNGYEYRGRKLAVSYSRSKEELEAENVGSSADGYDAQAAAEDAAAYEAATKASGNEAFGAPYVEPTENSSL